ncbi:MAG: diaminopimelate epimerase [Pirellulaceae bacterium]
MAIETRSGVRQLVLELEHDKVSRVTVDMGEPKLEAADVPTTLSSEPVINFETQFAGVTLKVTTVSMGNPHCVIFVPQATDELVLGLGPKIECDPRFPNRTNVEFIEVISPGELRQRTWERGSGETWACGTGASAVCVAGVLAGYSERDVLIHLRRRLATPLGRSQQPCVYDRRRDGSFQWHVAWLNIDMPKVPQPIRQFFDAANLRSCYGGWWGCWSSSRSTCGCRLCRIGLRDTIRRSILPTLL